MALNLLDSYGKRGVSYGLLTKPADIIDTDYTSKYFVVSEFSPTFTAGRNAVSFNGSSLLKEGSEILIECIDSAGNNLFIEMAVTVNSAARTYAYKESTAFVFSIHVYNDTSDGVGRLVIYGTLRDGRSVKWTRNITVDKTLQNSSKVRFYNRPLLEVDSVQVPILSTDLSNTLKTSINFNIGVYGLAVDPPKDTILPSVNRRNTNVDYRLISNNPVTLTTPAYQSINSQMIGATATVSPIVIQYPLTINDTTLYPAPTQSYVVAGVVNNNTFQLIDPYFYKDGKGNSVVTNITSASVSITYPFISYNTSTSSYLQSSINGVLVPMRQSYADITYRNIRTFSGFLARHKLYRKSLLSNADFSIIADEPLFINELLIDSLTQNKYYDLLGKFYNQGHIDRYWFTSSNNINLTHSADVYIDSVRLSSPSYNTLTGNDYIIVKNDSGASNRNAQYIPYDSGQFIATSGSSYDSNFMELKSNVQYIIQVDTVIEKDSTEDDARLELYFTSSVSDATRDTNFSSTHGIKMATLLFDKVGITRRVFDNVVFFYSPPADLFGTLVVVPYRCNSYLKNISFRVYGDDGFSPDVFTARLPWGISVANETFQIKAELFDINHNLVYSDLSAVQNFDPSGSSLVPYIPPGGAIDSGTGNASVSGSLYVSKSVVVDFGNVNLNHGDLVIQEGGLFVPNVGTQPRDAFLSRSRFLSIREDPSFPGQIVVNPVVDISHDDSYLYLTTGSLGVSNIISPYRVLTKQSIASQYATNRGGHIYYTGAGKQEQRPSGY